MTKIVYKLYLIDGDKLKLLDGLIRGSLSMDGAATEAKEIKKLTLVKEAFLPETGVELWEEVVQAVPVYRTKGWGGGGGG